MAGKSPVTATEEQKAAWKVLARIERKLTGRVRCF